MLRDDLKCVIALPSLVFGGTERAAVELSTYLSQNGYEVKLLLMYNQTINYDVHNNVEVIQPNEPWRKSFGKYLYIFYIIYFIRKQLFKFNPQIIIALGYVSLTTIASIGITAKLIISGRSSPSRIRYPKNKVLNYLYYFIKNRIKYRVDGIIAQTASAGNKYDQIYNIPITVIPNILREIKEYNYERENVIITVGRCVPEKAQHFLIEAFSKLKNSDWNLQIVGDGRLRTDLELMVNRLNVSEKVSFTGYQKDVDYYLSRAKVFVLSSLVEGFPNALIEGMANGLVPISFNIDAGPSDIIKHGINGYLIEKGNIEELQYYLHKLIHDNIVLEKLSNQAKIDSKKYNVKTIGKKYDSFIKSIL